MTQIVKVTYTAYAVLQPTTEKGWTIQYIAGDCDMDGYEGKWFKLDTREFEFEIPDDRVIATMVSGGIEKVIRDVEQKARRDVKSLEELQGRILGLEFQPARPSEGEKEVEQQDAEEAEARDWYFTFAQKSDMRNQYVSVHNATFAGAREWVEKHFKGEWAVQYTWEEFEPQIAKYGLEEFIPF